MSNDDIVMANYSMLLEVYFLFMDINLSLSGISLALLCERRDLKDRWEGNTQQVMKNNRKKII